ncbi:hypothetical protein ABB37_08583 [Leptomonas pyrrhocoris]|uniref:Secreted peptide n=1 Tax=Leptomonas pyrrhocoris TaxID=157538 RepID=A0A0N0VDJ6_LEPPY|nr:hypothetical protein ABB37_08583 [Leptomonas pyrrhocoris]KPA75282.1 hypothetical protein ABB37_08583 [Leptomonas pyrrhocoris]|eukprot:XP_015653721.1 hypothetical protein ABB37_08583 [Leptomonas pyrrhocoris]
MCIFFCLFVCFMLFTCVLVGLSPFPCAHRPINIYVLILPFFLRAHRRCTELLKRTPRPRMWISSTFGSFVLFLCVSLFFSIHLPRSRVCCCCFFLLLFSTQHWGLRYIRLYLSCVLSRMPTTTTC